MSTPNAGDLPENVRAEVEKIRTDERLNNGDPTSAEPEEVAPVQLSRRAKKEQERQEELQAERDRAKRAEDAVEELRRSREEDRARTERIERAMLELGAFARGATQQQQPTPEPKEPGDWREKFDRQMAKAKEALNAGDLDEYHKRFTKAQDIRQEARILPKIPDPRQFQQAPQQQQFVKPPWVQSVENEYPDVVQHQRGFEVTAQFLGILESDPVKRATPENLRKAFNRAREELGTKQRNEEQREIKRQLLAGGGSSPAARAGGSKGPVVNVKLAKGLNAADIARRAGMSIQDFARAYGQMNPGDVDNG